MVLGRTFSLQLSRGKAYSIAILSRTMRSKHDKTIALSQQSLGLQWCLILNISLPVGVLFSKKSVSLETDKFFNVAIIPLIILCGECLITEILHNEN